MKFYEIAEKVKSGEIEFDVCGHLISRSFKKIFLMQYENTLQGSNGSHDGQWPDSLGATKEETDLSMRNHYKFKLGLEIEEGERVSTLVTESWECQGCGKRLHWVLEGNKLSLKEYFDGLAKSGESFKGEFKRYPERYRCPYETPRPMGGEIQVASNLVFVNYFKRKEDRFADCPSEDLKYSAEYNLNVVIGRENILKYKCSNNIAYGQMSNMAIGIYLNQARDSVIIGPSYHPAEIEEFDTDEEFELAIAKPVFEGYEFKGQIILDVWRWEATDKNTIGEYPQGNSVELDVQHGKWRFEHYFDTMINDGDYCYSKFDLVK